jgi:hypothetical protein
MDALFCAVGDCESAVGERQPLTRMRLTQLTAHFRVCGVIWNATPQP